MRLFAADWRDAGAAPVHLARGTLGQVGISDGAFTAELMGPTASLDRPVVEETSPECRASLGDRRCRIDMGPRTRFARVIAASDTSVTIDAAEPGANAYGAGRLWWLDGPNSGLASLIAASSGAELTLREPPAFAPAAGTLVRVAEGCDRTIAACSGRFANAANFRGEPYLPGNDPAHPLSRRLTCAAGTRSRPPRGPVSARAFARTGGTRPTGSTASAWRRSRSTGRCPPIIRCAAATGGESRRRSIAPACARSRPRWRGGATCC